MNYLLIGKPNVGKSSIYNILTGFDSNIVHVDVGTTRDWHLEKIKNSSINIYDTPGVLIDDTNKKKILTTSFAKIIKNKIDNFLYVIDYNVLFNEIDNFAISKLRKYNKNIIVIANKFDNYNQSPSSEINKYKIKDVIFLSCTHRYGFDKLKKKIGVSKFNNYTDNKQKVDTFIAILGKPNVGKSTFLNTILGYERASTSPFAGTTSDYVSDKFYYNKKLYKIIDTAGIGKKANIKKKSINFYSIKKSFKNITKVDVVVILIDSKEGLDKQDKRIINMITDKAKSIILVFNKIDLIQNKKLFQSEIIKQIDYTLSQLKNIKIFFISAFNKRDISKILSYLHNYISEVNYIISTSKLNTWLKSVTKEIQHPLIENKKINFKYAVQIKQKPVTIKVFCSFSSKLKNNYKRYLINNFNQNFKILNQKTKFIFSSSKNPYI